MFSGFAVCVDPQIPCYAVCFVHVSLRACVFSWHIPMMNLFFAMDLVSIHIHLSSLHTIPNSHYFLFAFLLSAVYISHINLYHRNREALQRIVGKWHNKIG